MEKEKINIHKVLEEFNKIKIKYTQPTFMEISKYPHYENVCSNILEFFFKNTEIPELDKLLISSILNIINKKKYINLDLIDSQREYTTNKGNRIDLFLEYEEFTVTIENKIYANLNNDLDDYKNYINTKYKTKKNYFIILSLNETISKKFINITYKKFIEEINLKNYSITDKSNYLYYLDDFLKTMENLYIKNKTQKEISIFLIKNEKNIVKLLEQIDLVNKEVKNKVTELQSDFKKVKLKNKFFIYNGDDYSKFTTTLFTTISSKNSISVGIDINCNLEEWFICIFVRNIKDENKLVKLIQNNKIIYDDTFSNEKIKHSRFVIKRFDKNVKSEEIIKITKEVINKLLK